MDRHSREQRSKNMRAIKNKGTKIEKLLGKAMWIKGFRYRKNDKSVFGRPDFTFKTYKVAVFCDSEFFHGKDWETQKLRIKSRQEFWYNKIESNMTRDILVNTTLHEAGWTVIRLWGEEVKKDIEGCVEKIETALKNNGKIFGHKGAIKDRHSQDDE